MRRMLPVACLFALAMLVGCGGGDRDDSSGSSSSGDLPQFTLAWSEYPSWSVFGVAHELALIDADAGKVGEIEKKWGVDIVLKQAGYDSCLNLYTGRNVDAVCMTNMDAYIVCPKRPGAAFLPTSTSFGADACIVVGIDDLEQLKSHKVYGLEGTVSQYCFVRCIEEMEKKEMKGYKPEQFQFSNQDPAAAAVAMSQKEESHKAIMVWNPFVLQTLKDRTDAKVLFSSEMIPGEIVDMVVIGEDVLKKPGADKFAQAVIDVFYRMDKELKDAKTGDEATVALGKQFSNLNLEEMRTALTQTRFYATADDAMTLMDGQEFKDTMGTVKQFCTDYELVGDEGGFSFESGVNAPLRFDSSFLKSWKSAP